jgi:hypothetical protein
MSLTGIDKKFRAATIRHVTISYWWEKGFSVKQVMEHTGHCSAHLVWVFYDRGKQQFNLMAHSLISRVNNNVK